MYSIALKTLTFYRTVFCPPLLSNSTFLICAKVKLSQSL